MKLKQNITLSVKFQNQIDKSWKEAKSIALAHKYMTEHLKVAVLNQYSGPKTLNLEQANYDTYKLY